MEQTLKTNWKKLSREERGKLIFENGRISKKHNFWVVGSQTSFRAYKVSFAKDEPKCSCPDCELRHKKCKHIYAVEYYLKREIDEKGKITETRGVMTIWGKMYHYFLYKHDEFLEHYHKRSNVESYFNMVKTKFGDNLMSKKKTAQEVELLCKHLANNITIVIQEINELGVKAEFNLEETISV